ncbi:MAG: Cu(I)-responsive transcriptional regulator [Paracoccus sp. (in: a-proteobacteria)]|nr:Cu(I)-responsive transcriptional regulator [Paracoccus sp. (in: a-proteobacteria)]
MNIGEASRLSGVSAKMIRYYEQIALVPPAARTGAGYRDYSDADIHMLRFIARARDLGFGTSDISGLLDLWRDKDRRSADVKAMAQARVQELRQKIAHLQAMAGTLEDLANSCAGNGRPDCPILHQLGSPDAPAPAARGATPVNDHNLFRGLKT